MEVKNIMVFYPIKWWVWWKLWENVENEDKNMEIGLGIAVYNLKLHVQGSGKENTCP